MTLYTQKYKSKFVPSTWWSPRHKDVWGVEVQLHLYWSRLYMDVSDQLYRRHLSEMKLGEPQTGLHARANRNTSRISRESIPGCPTSRPSQSSLSVQINSVVLSQSCVSERATGNFQTLSSCRSLLLQMVLKCQFLMQDVLLRIC
jgi:hypothetical protein